MSGRQQATNRRAPSPALMELSTSPPPPLLSHLQELASLRPGEYLARMSGSEKGVKTCGKRFCLTVGDSLQSGFFRVLKPRRITSRWDMSELPGSWLPTAAKPGPSQTQKASVFPGKGCRPVGVVYLTNKEA